MAGSGIALRLPAPVGKQKDVIYLDEGGEHLVLGTAGSGKTLMAIYRAVYLAQHAPRNAGSTLLLTFHQTLVTYIKSLVPADTKQLTIETFHGFARGYLASQDMLRDNEILTPSNHERFLAHAAAQVASRLGTSTIFDKKPAFFADEYRFIVGHRQRRDQYIAANDGRGHALNQQQRSRIYDVMERYWSLRREHGFRYCWDDLAPIAARQLRGDTTERRYKHIVVDESQDLPPAAVDALTQATGVGGSLTLFGDYAQQIHLAGTASADIGLENAKLTIFQDNYRNTAQISRLALALSRLPTFRSNADLVEPREPRADGAPPTIWRHADQTQQMTAAVQLAQQDSSSRQVAILLRRREDEADLRRLLGRTPATRLHRSVRIWPMGSGVFYGTYHAARGLEFDTVIMPLLDENLVPNQREIEVLGREEAAARESNLLYVGITRAKANLVLMHSSSLTSLLPSPSSGLFTEVSGAAP